MNESDQKPTEMSAVHAVWQKKVSSRQTKLLGLLLVFIVNITAGFLGGWIASNSRSGQLSLGSSSPTVQQQIVLNESQLISTVAKQVGPSVVSVNVESREVGASLLGRSQIYTQVSAGTGVIISVEGLVITNRHVVPVGTTKVSITLSDGTELDDVSIVGRTSENDSLDIAFLRINNKKGKSLTPAKLGDSSKVQVGDKVIAIGNALGQFHNTVTSGIISGFGRSVQAGDETKVETLQNLFQTDTAINQGNSGGPLVNINGEVIAINTAVAGDAENIGFAIPINDLKGLISGVLEKGKLERAYLGVRYISLTDDYAYQLGLSTKRGAYIVPSDTAGDSSVLPDSPAEKAGLREEDIIVKVEDTTIDESNSLTAALSRFKVGQKVRLEVIRKDKKLTVEVVLEAAPEE